MVEGQAFGQEHLVYLLESHHCPVEGIVVVFLYGQAAVLTLSEDLLSLLEPIDSIDQPKDVLRFDCRLIRKLYLHPFRPKFSILDTLKNSSPCLSSAAQQSSYRLRGGEIFKS